MENRNLVLGNEFNVNLKLKGEIQELQLRLREKDELVRLLRSTVDKKDSRIEELEKELESITRKNKSLSLQSENMRKTLEAFNIIGKVEEGTEMLNQKNKFLKAFKEDKVSQKLCSFLLPRDMSELSFCSKLSFSLLRQSPGLMQAISKNTMFDKYNIKYTVVRGNRSLIF